MVLARIQLAVACVGRVGDGVACDLQFRVPDPQNQHEQAQRIRLGCVSFLNAKPLIDGLDSHPLLDVSYAVPSALLERLEGGDVDAALCPVIDYQVSAEELELVPVGGIGCDGPTLTVRLFSKGPIGKIASVAVDGDSHTSVSLMRVLLAELHGIRPEVLGLNRSIGAGAEANGERQAQIQNETDALLLIGDKVVTGAPTEGDYPHQMDLGEAWKLLTDLPFVFATWMARRGAKLGEAPSILDKQRRKNRRDIRGIVGRHAAGLGWPEDLAAVYLGELLRYGIGPRELEAINRFWRLAERHGVISKRREMVIQAGFGGGSEARGVTAETA